MAEEKSSSLNGAIATKGVRGISYPSIPLENAISRAQQFYNAEKKGAAPLPSAAEHWGYSSKSSGTRQLVSALIQYGLMEDDGSNEGRVVKLTGRALDILLAEPESSVRWVAIQEAAQAPKIHAEILSKFSNWRTDGLPSDSTLKFYLLREKNFNDDAVDGFIKDFRSTIAFSKLDKPAIISVSDLGNSDQKLKQSTSLTDKVNLGDLVQWEWNGILQFAKPTRVVGFTEFGDFLFVEGSNSGIPVNEVTVMQAAEKVNPVTATQAQQSGFVPPLKPATGMRQDILSLDEGNVVLQCPSQISAESYEDFEAWIQIQLRKIKRSISN